MQVKYTKKGFFVNSQGNLSILLVATIILLFSGVFGINPKIVKASSTPCTGSNCVNLNSGTTYQTMIGWEATAQVGQNEFPTDYLAYKDQLFDNAVNDLGINSLRLEVYSGTENPTDYYTQYRTGVIDENQFYSSILYNIVNDNGDPNTINSSGFQFSYLDNQMDEIALPMKTLLEARGETLHINVNYTDFGSSAFEHKSNPSEYAEFVLATYQHMQSAYGIVPDTWEVILEPDTPSANWTPTQIGQAIKAAGDRLVSAGFTPHFIAPSVTNGLEVASTGQGGNDWATQINAVSGAMAYIDTISYHRFVILHQMILKRKASLLSLLVLAKKLLCLNTLPLILIFCREI